MDLTRRLKHVSKSKVKMQIKNINKTCEKNVYFCRFTLIMDENKLKSFLHAWM